MINIMCYGDSNTHGARPDAPTRYGWDQRWTGRLQNLLGSGYRIIEEGLNGRTTVFEDPVEGDKSGKTHLPSLLLTHAPLDLVVLMLGTNDFKLRLSMTPTDIAWATETLIDIILKTDNERETPPRILLLAPTYLQESTFLGEIIGNRYADSIRLGELLEALAERRGIDFLNIAKITGPSEIDGLHFDLEGHRKIADALNLKIRSMFA